MTIKKVSLIMLSILCLVLVGALVVDAAQGPSLVRQVIGSGDHLEQGSYSLDNTLGQPVVGRTGQNETSLCVGFWCNSAEVRSVYVPFVVRSN
jgi:hypothetical protein